MNFYCHEAVFNCAISAGYNKLITSFPSYDTHRWTLNCRGFDTFCSQSNYAGAIQNTLYGTVDIPGTCTIEGNTTATQSWVTIQNYLTAVPSAIACDSFTISGNTAATQTWVKSQNIITSTPDMVAPITYINPAAPTSFSQIGYSQTLNVVQCGGTAPVNLTINSFNTTNCKCLHDVGKYYIRSYVNEVRTMHCSRVVYCSSSRGTLYVALIYPTGPAGTLQLVF